MPVTSAQVRAMEKLRENAHVLRLRAVAYIGPKGQEDEAFLLLDLCRQNLVDYVRQLSRPLQDAEVSTIFQSICSAVAAMHKQEPPLIHRQEMKLSGSTCSRVQLSSGLCSLTPLTQVDDDCVQRRDLKAENVLQHSNGDWVLCDFGSTTSWVGHYEGANAIMVAEEDVRKNTTPAYRPPEVSADQRCMAPIRMNDKKSLPASRSWGGTFACMLT